MRGRFDNVVGIVYNGITSKCWASKLHRERQKSYDYYHHHSDNHPSCVPRTVDTRRSRLSASGHVRRPSGRDETQAQDAYRPYAEFGGSGGRPLCHVWRSASREVPVVTIGQIGRTLYLDGIATKQDRVRATLLLLLVFALRANRGDSVVNAVRSAPSEMAGHFLWRSI